MQRLLGTSVIELDLERAPPLGPETYVPRVTNEGRPVEDRIRTKLLRDRAIFLDGPELSGKTSTLTAALSGWDGGAPFPVTPERWFTLDLRKHRTAHSKDVALALSRAVSATGLELRHVLAATSRQGAAVIVLDHFDDHYGTEGADDLLIALNNDWVYGTGARASRENAVYIVVMTAAARGDYFDRERCVSIQDLQTPDALQPLLKRFGTDWTPSDCAAVFSRIGGHVGTVSWLAMHASDSSGLAAATSDGGILGRLLFEHRNWFSTLDEREVNGLRDLVRNGTSFPFSSQRASQMSRHAASTQTSTDARYAGCKLVSKGVLEYARPATIRYGIFQQMVRQMFPPL